MVRYIKVDDEDEIEWFKKFIAKMTNPNHSSVNFLIANDRHLRAWYNYLCSESETPPLSLAEKSKPQPRKTSKTRGRGQPSEPSADTPKRRGRPPGSKNGKPAAKKDAVKEVNHFGCNDHKTYGIKYAPRSDCSRCWELYKKLHPMDYPRARRKFELKMRQLK